MRLLVLSDLHREFWTKHQVSFASSLQAIDVVVLAGDIDTSGVRVVDWAEEVFQDTPVVYVAGNHEGYGSNLDRELEKIRSAAQATRNVHFLDCDEIVVGGVRFLGATLWTDFALFGEEAREDAMAKSEAVLNDYRRIRLKSAGYRKLRATDTLGFHETHKSWLTAKLATRYAGHTVVVTHMAPSFRSVSAQYRDDLTSSAYASDVEDLVRHADLWIHGHMHESVDYAIANCRVVCNPFGYMTKDGNPENPLFDPAFLVQL